MNNHSVIAIRYLWFCILNVPLMHNFFSYRIKMQITKITQIHCRSALLPLNYWQNIKLMLLHCHINFELHLSHDIKIFDGCLKFIFSSNIHRFNSSVSLIKLMVFYIVRCHNNSTNCLSNEKQMIWILLGICT